MLKDRTVLITGGGSGIGLALAQALLAQDNQVIICGRTRAKLEAARAEHPALTIYTCDVTDPAAVETMFATLGREGLTPDVLVNNAAVFHSTVRSDQITPALVRDEVNTNVTAPMLLSLTFIRSNSVQANHAKPAVILNIGSLSAWLALRTQPVYAATKAALHVFSVALRDLLEQEGNATEVFEVMTPSVDTAMVANLNMSKMSPYDLADKVISAVERGQREIIIGRDGYLTLALHRFAPRLLRRIGNRVAENALKSP